MEPFKLCSYGSLCPRKSSGCCPHVHPGEFAREREQGTTPPPPPVHAPKQAPKREVAAAAVVAGAGDPTPKQAAKRLKRSPAAAAQKELDTAAAISDPTNADVLESLRAVKIGPDFRDAMEKKKISKREQRRGDGSSGSGAALASFDEVPRAYADCYGMALGLGGARARTVAGGMGFALLTDSRDRPNLTRTLTAFGRKFLAPEFSFTTIQVSGPALAKLARLPDLSSSATLR